MVLAKNPTGHTLLSGGRPSTWQNRHSSGTNFRNRLSPHSLRATGTLGAD
jgi:hypothetical protein